MDNLVPYHQAMDALKRLALKYRNKETTLVRQSDKRYAKARAELFESVIYYLDIRNAKANVQGTSREEVPQGIDLFIGR
jgi:hypothetical protein